MNDSLDNRAQGVRHRQPRYRAERREGAHTRSHARPRPASSWTVTGSSSNACGSAAAGATTFGYDNKGNRTSTVPATGSATCPNWDQPNRLTEIQYARRLLRPRGMSQGTIGLVGFCIAVAAAMGVGGLVSLVIL